MTVDAFTRLASSFSGLAVAFQLVELGLRVNDVPIDSLVFVELVANVQADLDHAIACQRDLENVFAAQSSYHKNWILDTILRTVKALDEIGSYILGIQVGHEKSPPLRRRITYVLHDYKKLSDREKWLRASHNSLLSAITAMHMLIYPRFRTEDCGSARQRTVPELSTAQSPQRDQSPWNHLTPSSQRDAIRPQISPMPSPQNLPFESTQSLSSFVELAGNTVEWSPQSSTVSRPLKSPSSVPETEYAYPELENAFQDADKPSNTLQRPSRQKPSESTHTTLSTLKSTRNDSVSTFSSTTTEVNLWQRSHTSLPETSRSEISLLDTTRSSTELPCVLPSRNSLDAGRRPSRQRPQPRPHSSFSDNVLSSANVKLDNLSPMSTSSEPVDTEQSRRTSLEGDEKIAATVAYQELADYIQLLRRESTKGQRPKIKISM